MLNTPRHYVLPSIGCPHVSALEHYVSSSLDSALHSLKHYGSPSLGCNPLQMTGHYAPPSPKYELMPPWGLCIAIPNRQSSLHYWVLRFAVLRIITCACLSVTYRCAQYANSIICDHVILAQCLVAAQHVTCDCIVLTHYLVEAQHVT